MLTIDKDDDKFHLNLEDKKIDVVSRKKATCYNSLTSLSIIIYLICNIKYIKRCMCHKIVQHDS